MANRGNLSRATDSSDAPTPGYLYIDIAKNAASSPVACQEIATYLTRRLASKNNPNIKYKCLKVIAKTATSDLTRGQFKRCVAQDAQAVACIKDALQYRGQADPARGDELNARVRAAAKEALDAVYSDTPSSYEHSTHNAGLSGGGGGGISSQSYGSGGGYAGGGGGGGYGGGGAPPPTSSSATKRMEGIGNPMFSDPRLAQQSQKTIGNMTIGEVVGVAGETIAGMIKDPLARNVDVGGGGPSRQSGMPGYGSSSGNYGAPPPPGSSQLARETNGQWTMASNRGPNAVSSTSNSEYYKARDAAGSGGFQWAQQQQSSGGGGGGVGGSWGASGTTARPSVASQARVAPSAAGGGYSAGATTTTTTTNSGTGGTAVSDGSYEKALIMELCPPGGMKAEPPPDKLAAFTRSVPSLNPDLVCPALLDALEDGQPWIIRAKALCVMEVTIKVSERNNISAYADFFLACLDEITPLAGHARAAISNPAKRVLKALGVQDDSIPKAAAPAAAPPAPPAEVPNLLDFDDAPEPTVAPAVPTTTEAAAAPPAPAAAPPPAAAAPTSLFGGMQIKESASGGGGGATKSSTASATNGGLLGEAPTPAAAAVTATSTSSDLFGDVKVKTTTTTSAPTSTTTSAAAEAQEVGKAAAAGGSAFGFINGGTAAVAPAEAAKPEEPKKAAPPTKESFDPLLSLGTDNSNTSAATPMSPSTAHKQAMQLSTAQMQAMAYQQMMMQQQMQMQQMQMAMAMQGNPRMVGMQQQHQQSSMPNLTSTGTAHPNVMHMNSSGAAASSSFSFLDVGAKPPQKDDKKFDFVKDAFKEETKK